jgi:hypothetical protein
VAKSKPLELVWGRNLEKCGDAGQRSLECCEQRLLGSSGGSSEDQNASRNEDRDSCAHEVSGGNKDSVGIELRAVHVTLWKRTFLHFVGVLRLHEWLSLKVTD